MIQAVIFDFDGTLVDSNDIKKKAFYSVTKNIDGADSLLDKILSTPESGDRYDIFTTLSKKLKLVSNISVDSSKLSHLYTQLCENEISRARELLGVSEALNQLNKLGIKLFISSATPESTLRKIIDVRGWSGIFDTVLGAPSKKIEHVKKISAQNNFVMSDIVYVGDSAVDRETAILAGCHFIGVGANETRFNHTPPPVLIDTFYDFIGSINRIS